MPAGILFLNIISKDTVSISDGRIKFDEPKASTHIRELIIPIYREFFYRDILRITPGPDLSLCLIVRLMTLKSVS